MLKICEICGVLDNIYTSIVVAVKCCIVAVSVNINIIIRGVAMIVLQLNMICYL